MCVPVAALPARITLRMALNTLFAYICLLFKRTTQDPYQPSPLTCSRQICPLPLAAAPERSVGSLTAPKLPVTVPPLEHKKRKKT